MTVPGPSPRHPEIVDAAVRGYLLQLRQLASELRHDGNLGAVVTEVIALHEKAVAEGPSLRPDDVPPMKDQFRNLSDWQRLAILDQCALGYGRDDSQIIVMGTEEAYEAAEGGDLAIACSMSVLWLTGSRADILAKIDRATADKGPPGARPYHLHPNDYHPVQQKGARHTWKGLARILRPDNARALLEFPPAPAEVSLGDLCYQIDVSAYPSKRALGGRKPTPERTEFLCEFVRRFDQARLLLFHGGDWDQPRRQIAEAFLGGEVERHKTGGPRHEIAWQSTSDRAVLRINAPSGAVPYSYLDAVNAKIRELVPDALQSGLQGDSPPSGGSSSASRLA